MGQCLVKLPHQCGTRKGLQVFSRDDGSVDGFCYSCKTYVRHPYGEEKKTEELPKPKVRTQEEIELEIAEVGGYPSPSLPSRKLRGETLEYFSAKVGLSESDGKTPQLLYYPYTKQGKLVGYKVKLLDQKRIWSVGDLKDVDLYGWEQAISLGAKRLIITEGEDDAMAFHQTLLKFSKDEFKDFTAVCSLPHGVHNAKEFMSKNYKKIKQYFDEIILCFDMDEPGQEAVKEVSSICPDVNTITIPAKDANECVIQGRSKALYNSLFKKNKPKNTRLVFGEDLHEAAKEAAKYGDLTWPWDHINKDTRGIRYGETIYIGAGVKLGKSELVNSLAAHFIKKHGIKVFLAKPEEVNKKTYKLLAGKIVGRVFHDPDKEFDEAAYDKAGEILSGKVGMVDLYQHIGWSSLKDDIIAAIGWGAKAIFIDPITNLTSGMNSAEANVELEKISQELSVIAKDHEVVIFIFAHLKAPEGNLSKEKREKYYRDGQYIGLGTCPHESGGSVYSNQFAGSRAMMRSCNMMIGMEGNKDADLEEERRNIRHLVVLEDREFGVTGRYPLYWAKDSTLFKEI